MALSTIGTNSVADSAVTSAKISDGTIATGDLANDAVTGAKVADLDALTVSGDLTVQGTTTSQGTTVGFVDDKLLLNATDGSATDAGDNLILNGTDATSANADSNILFESGTGDPSIILSSPAAILTQDSQLRIPTRPAFHARSDDQSSINFTSAQDGEILPFGTFAYTVVFDIGNNFNATTGVYTVPISGLYQINYFCAMTSVAAATAIKMRLFKADNNMGDLIEELGIGVLLSKSQTDPQGGGQESCGASNVYNLNKDETLVLTLESDNDTSVAVQLLTFSGHFIG